MYGRFLIDHIDDDRDDDENNYQSGFYLPTTDHISHENFKCVHIYDSKKQVDLRDKKERRCRFLPRGNLISLSFPFRLVYFDFSTLGLVLYCECMPMYVYRFVCLCAYIFLFSPIYLITSIFLFLLSSINSINVCYLLSKQ